MRGGTTNSLQEQIQNSADHAGSAAGWAAHKTVYQSEMWGVCRNLGLSEMAAVGPGGLHLWL